MNDLEDLIMNFDLMLSKHSNTTFTIYEINNLLEKLNSDKNMQKYCFDFFVKYNILQKNNLTFYYTFDKCYRYNTYKNYIRIKKLFDTELCSNFKSCHLK